MTGETMIIKATELKNRLGKYLRDCVKEDIIITSNGQKVAKLISFQAEESDAEKYGAKPSVLSEEAGLFYDVPQEMSYEDFLKLNKNTEKRYEFIDGEVYLIASPKTIHQRLLGDLHILFHDYIKNKKCSVILCPYDITLRRNPGNINIVQPDMVIICDLEEKLNENDYYMGVPALVLEIISASTRSKDFVKKLDLYMSTGVKEYWIINPFSKEISIYIFEDHQIKENATYKKGEQAASFQFRGLVVDVGALFL
jgi:prevent-host-death family protein